MKVTIREAVALMFVQGYLRGGGLMVPMTSPNDPVFFLHYYLVDKVWADRQALQQRENAEGSPHYAPLEAGPPGHNIDDTLKPWQRTIRQVLDISQLGYSYEQPATQPRLMAVVERIRPRSPFETERSPFWAD